MSTIRLSPSLFILALAPALTAVVSAADSKPVPATTGVADHSQPAIAAPIKVSVPTPMVAELLAAVDQQKLQLGEIRKEIRRTRDHARRLELQRRVETIKR